MFSWMCSAEQVWMVHQQQIAQVGLSGVQQTADRCIYHKGQHQVSCLHHQGECISSLSRRCVSAHMVGKSFLHVIPPLPLIQQFVQKIIRNKTYCILVTPWWPRQPWFLHLLNLSINTYLQLPPAPSLLLQENKLVLHGNLTLFWVTEWRILH